MRKQVHDPAHDGRTSNIEIQSLVALVKHRAKVRRRWYLLQCITFPLMLLVASGLVIMLWQGFILGNWQILFDHSVITVIGGLLASLFGFSQTKLQQIKQAA